MTSPISPNPNVTLSFIGEVACNDEKSCKVLCKELLKNTPIEEIEAILSQAIEWNQSHSRQENINTQIGALSVYRQILKKETDPSIFTKAANAAYSVFGTENNDLQKTRLELFEQLFSNGAGYDEAIEIVKYAVGANKTDSFIIQLLTLLMRYDKEIESGFSVFRVFTDCYYQPELKARELIPFFEVLAEKKEEVIKTNLINMIKTSSQLSREQDEVKPDIKEKILLFIEAAIKKDLFIQELYDSTIFFFTNSISRLYKDEMRFPSEILNVFINLNSKRPEIHTLILKAQLLVNRLEDDSESTNFKQKKLEYITHLNLTNQKAQSTKSARNKI